VARYYVSDSDVANYREDFMNPVINSNGLPRSEPAISGDSDSGKISQIDSALAGQPNPHFFWYNLSSRTDRINDAYQTV